MRTRLVASRERQGVAAATAPGATPSEVLRLDDASAEDVSLAGAKAAALARARAAGLPALPGFVLTTAGVDRWRTGEAHALTEGNTETVAAVADLLRRAWEWLSELEQHPVIVRSSSPVEDSATESHAGLFTSVLDVRTWADFVRAIDDVVASAGGAPMAVLVQPFIEPKWGGVLFGVDPVTNRQDRLVVAAVPGGPDRLVGGLVDGVHVVMSRQGRVLETTDEASRRLLSRSARRGLAQLSRRVAMLFGGPQDIEWAIGRDGRLILLQSRPITTLAARVRASGPVLGPGPVAETFGGPLAPLEEDLWVAPLREGLRRALTIAGAASRRQLAASPVVVTVGGRVAADLRLLGIPVGRRSALALLDPRPPARRLVAAWRVGRLRAALPVLAEDLIVDVDADLRSIPALETLDPSTLLRLLRRSHQTLAALHGYEALAGLLLDEDDQPATAAAAALRVLASVGTGEREHDRDRDGRGADAPDGRANNDDELIARHPVLLALTAPSIERLAPLPPAPSVPPQELMVTREAGTPAPFDGPVDVPVREMLRLRIRWVQEVTARAARAVGAVLVERGLLTEPGEVAALPLERLQLIVSGAASIRRRPRVDEARVAGPPLPAAFQLSESGEVVPFRPARAGRRRPEPGRGAGGGRGVGLVHTDATTKPPPGSVLVVRSLDPALASVLPDLAGLVAETGSVLSHLAILAREYGVPTVVGVPGATTRFAPGTQVVVDGSTGEVAAVTPVGDERGAA